MHLSQFLPAAFYLHSKVPDGMIRLNIFFIVALFNDCPALVKYQTEALAEADDAAGIAEDAAAAAHSLLVVSENGLGKRTLFAEYRPQSRAGIGIKTMNCTEKTGLVVSATTVTDADELMIMTSGGQSVRMKVNTIRTTGRATQGVKLITLNDKESIQEITLVIPDDEEDDEPIADDAEADAVPPAEADAVEE